MDDYSFYIKDSTNVLSELENIDDEADVFKIRFVRIHDIALAEDYSLYYMPSLVYFRSGIPIVYDGNYIIIILYIYIYIMNVT